MFVLRVRAAAPDARVYHLSMKPSWQRWVDWPQARAANALIAKICATDPRLTYIDVATPMLATRIIRPRLEADLRSRSA